MNIIQIIELRDAVGTNEKQNVLKKYSQDKSFCSFLYFALNPLITYNLSEKTLSDFTEQDNVECTFSDIFECCEFLSRLRGIDDSTVKQVKSFLHNQCQKEERDIYIKLLSKTLRLGVTAKSVNKAIPFLIPEWEVQQAYPIEKYPIKDGDEFWLTQKLNGVRATFYKGQFISRSGIPYEGLDHIIKEILPLAQSRNIVLDGELTLRDKGELNDNEAFRVATGIINSDDVYKTGICYTIFDAIPIKDFENSKPFVKYSDRRMILNDLSAECDAKEYTKVLPVLYHGCDVSKIDVYLGQMVQEDKEGLMVNLDVPYKRTRHKGILKVKRFYTMDLPIVRCEEGTGRLKDTLGSFVLEYKGNEVKVGTGFTDEQRKAFWERKEDVVGLLCEVKYKEISYDKNTSLESLQFPVFIQLRDDKSEVSYG